MVKTFFFESRGGGVVSTDISSLDVEAEDSVISDWGGLSSFSGRASDVVSKYYQEDGGK